MIRTVIFDIGGTLLAAPDLIGELARLFPDDRAADLLRKGVLGRYRSIAGGGLPFATMEAIIAEALREVSAQLGCTDQSPHAFGVYHGTFVEKSSLYPDTLVILEWLKARGIDMVVASDGDYPLLRDEFAMHGFGGYFRSVFISSEVGAYKPNGAFVEALRQAVPNPREALFVGDSACDVETGRALGALTVQKGGAESESAPDYRIDTLNELIGIIEKIG